MAARARVKVIFGLYLMTLVVVFWDFYQKGFTLRYFDVVKLSFFVIWTLIAAILIWKLRE